MSDSTMSDSTAHQRDTNSKRSFYPPARQAPSGPILVATDGTTAGEAAFCAASVIAAKSSSSVQVPMVVGRKTKNIRSDARSN